ncbi:MAG: hypothetical protein KTR15_07805 [Phycisphaeraceae bacterium]|nr:hypothetical protein [Phycisphaeraceae bacterium]
MTIQESSPIIDPIEDELLTDAQVGRLLGVSPASVCRYRMKGKRGVKLPWTWCGRRRVTTRACLDWWHRELQRAAQDIESIDNAQSRQLDPALEAECEAAGI